MDKFGIYNLLFGLLKSFNSKKNDDKPLDKENFSLANEKNSTNNSDNSNTISPQKSNRNSDYLPLQSDMIKTMTNHDEFIRRVTKNNSH